MHEPIKGGRSLSPSRPQEREKLPLPCYTLKAVTAACNGSQSTYFKA